MIPLHTTFIKVVRYSPANPGGQDPYEPKIPNSELTIAENVRAQISSPTGKEIVAGGSQEIVQFQLSCDPVDLRNTDQVIDQTTGEKYEVIWARKRTGLSLDHTRAALKQVSGLA